MAEVIILAKHRRFPSKAITTDGKKICNVCNKPKPIEEYQRADDGKCKACKCEHRKKRSKERKDNEFGGFF